MIDPAELKYIYQNQQSEPEKLSLLADFLVRVSRFGRGTQAFKVMYFEKILNFIRVLSLYIVSKNDFMVSLSGENVSAGKPESRITSSFIDLLYNLNILLYKNDKLLFNKKYDTFIDNDKNLLISLFEEDFDQASRLSNIVVDFLFIRDLINKYRNNQNEPGAMKKSGSRWEQMIEDGRLNYEIRLAETLYELSRLRIPHKIEAPFDEDYYTESGRNAFKNFTQYKFIDIFTEMVKKRDEANIIDIGCGYGNYIDVLNANYPMFHITGIETQKKVYEETYRKFGQTDNIDIIHGDFFKHKFERKFDIILVNYVLFYFNRKEKVALLKKAKELLSENGSIIVCQYFSGIERLKKELALKQNEWSRYKEIEMFYSNKILYANTLWNDAADTFSESVKWNEFLEVIIENDLKINGITNADKFYYSFFIELTPKK